MYRARVLFPPPAWKSVCLALGAALLSSCAAPEDPGGMRAPRPVYSEAPPPDDTAVPRPPAPPIVPPDAAAAEVPPGFRVEIAVSHLTFPTSVEFDDHDNLYIAEAGAAPGGSSAPPRILRISPTGQIDVMTDKLHPPVNDLLWHNGRLYVSQHGRICVVDPEGAIRETAAGPLLDRRDHHQLCSGPDGLVYVAQGTPPSMRWTTTRSTTTPAMEERAATVRAAGAILALDADHPTPRLAHHLPFGSPGLAITAEGRMLVCSDPDEAAQSALCVLDPAGNMTGILPGTRSPLAKLCAAPLAAWRFGSPQTLFVAGFRDASAASPAASANFGSRVLRVDLANSSMETFLTARITEDAPADAGFRSPAGPRQPIDVVFSRDGSAMYVVDFGVIHTTPSGARGVPETGVLWRILPTDAATGDAQPPSNLSPPPDRK